VRYGIRIGCRFFVPAVGPGKRYFSFAHFLR
jgi:hypothetical protein